MTDPLTPLTPPESLQAPAAVPAVKPEQGRNMTPLSSEDQKRLDDMARAFVQEVLQSAATSSTFAQKLNAAHDLGLSEQRQAAQVSSRLLERPLRNSKANTEESSAVMQGLSELRRTVEDLDPSRPSTSKRLFGLLPAPASKKIQSYMERYTSAQDHLNAILDTLYRSQDELRKDNAALETEKVALWSVMQKLRQYAYVGQAVDDALSAQLSVLEQKDPDKARIVREELLFGVRQRVTDLLTQLALSVQGYLALDLIRKNNLELIKGVDRATTTTVSALRTAVLVSQALGTQQLVLDQVSALNTTTGNMIENTGAMLKTQSARIHQGAGSATVNPEQIQRAFESVYAAMDAVSEYKQQALTNLAQTTQVLAREVERAQHYLDQERQQTSQEVIDKLNIGAQVDKGGDLKL